MFRCRSREPAHSPDVVDLTDDLRLTFQLLDDTQAWRHRLVENSLVGAGDHLRRTAAYQLELPPALMSGYVVDGHGMRVRALLPITTKRKRPLLNFAIDGPSGKPAELLTRASIASIQATYLQTLLATSPAGSGVSAGISIELLEAICGFTPAVFREYDADASSTRYLASKKKRLLAVYHNYLTDGLGFEVPSGTVSDWMELQRGAGEQLRGALNEPPAHDSSSEQVLLALPRLHKQVRTVDEVDRMVKGYVAVIDQLAAAGDENFLVALADYGRRWEVIVETDVPLEQPFQVKIHEDLPVTLRRGWLRQSDAFALGDARSAHLEMRVNDPHVKLDKWRVLETGGSQEVGVPLIEAARHTRESLAIYSSETDRPYYVRVSLKLRVIPEIALATWFVAVLSFLATVALAVIPDSSSLEEVVGILTVPTTFAAALVLVRESSALAIRLQSSARAVLAALTAVLWVVALARLLVEPWPMMTLGG